MFFSAYWHTALLLRRLAEENYSRITDGPALYIQHVLTAGRAKNDMPIMAQAAAISFPIHVTGTASPYPTVHSVICNQ